MDHQEHKGLHAVAYWLFGCAVMVFIMVVLGGLTRLTHSGLSIVDWRPITGILPPLNQDTWDQVFALYKTSPEYLKVNKGMNLEGFKNIFWLEYMHRLWGRLIGLVFLLPLLYFTARRILSTGQATKLFAIFLLGFAQGVMGWYMVKSGLVDDPQVSPYRLMAHLSLAFVLFALLIGQGMTFKQSRLIKASNAMIFGLGIVFLTVLYGALVAGFKAGLTYNTFPLMNGQWIPEDGWGLKPFYRNLFENPSMIQWIHRILAILTFLYVHHLGAIVIRRWHMKPLGLSLIFLVWVQFILGVMTLLTQVDLTLATLHQANALCLWGVCVVAFYKRKSVAHI